MRDTAHEITKLLAAANRGDPKALDKLVPVVYCELRQRAAGYLSKERPDHTLEPTALVHEAYIRLVDQTRVQWRDRRHFFAIASTLMRRILVDYARKRQTDRRGGGLRRLPFDGQAVVDKHHRVQLLDLEEALKKIEAWNSRIGRVIELRYFGGLTITEVSEELDVDARTVQRDWKAARALLLHELAEDRR